MITFSSFLWLFNCLTGQTEPVYVAGDAEEYFFFRAGHSRDKHENCAILRILGKQFANVSAFTLLCAVISINAYLHFTTVPATRHKRRKDNSYRVRLIISLGQVDYVTHALPSKFLSNDLNIVLQILQCSKHKYKTMTKIEEKCWYVYTSHTTPPLWVLRVRQWSAPYTSLSASLLAVLLG